MKRTLPAILTSCLFFNAFSMDNKPIEKAILKQNRLNCEHVPEVKYSPDGHYFFENISDSPLQLQLHMWDTQQNKIVKIFPDYNRGKFSSNGAYAVVSFSGSAQGSMPVAPLLYSIKHDTSAPLLVDIGDKYSPFPPTIELSSNNRYIKLDTVNLDTHEYEYFLMQYSDTDNHVTNIDLSNWGAIQGWKFTSDGNSYSDAQHILYIKDGKTLVKRDIASDKDIITYPIDANGNLYVDDCLVSLTYQNWVRLLFIKNNTVQEIRNTPDPDADSRSMNILYIPETGLIIYQSGRLSFEILNKDYKKIGSYSLKDAEGYDGAIKMFVINENKNNLVAVYDDSSITPSRIICFDLSNINESNTTNELLGTELKCTMQILALKFIANKKLLAQGTKTKIMSIDGKKSISMGESQSSSMHGNSILTIYHTPFNRYSMQDLMNTIPAKTKLCKYVVDQALLDQ